MKKTLLTSVVTLSLGAVSNLSALTIDVTAMVLNSNSYIASGELSSIVDDSYPYNYGSATGTLFFQPWETWAIEYFDDTSGTALHFEGTDYTNGEYFDYAFTLSEGQIAWGLLVSWGGSNDHPILNIMDCGAGNPGDTCTGIGTPMQTVPFPGVEFSYDGVVLNAVPIPAATWLFSIGLLGLVGLARREVCV